MKKEIINNYHNLIIEYKPLKKKKNSFITLIKINAPNQNQLTFTLLKELKDALFKSSTDTNQELIILHSKFKSVFISESEILDFKKQKVNNGISWAKLGHQITELLETMSKPTIAGIEGKAIGNGAEIAMACDFIFATQNAELGYPEFFFRLIPNFGGIFRLIKLVGLAKTKEIIFSQSNIDAHHAYSIGLIQKIFPSENFIESIVSHVEEKNLNANPAFFEFKKLFNEFSKSREFLEKKDLEIKIFNELLNKNLAS